MCALLLIRGASESAKINAVMVAIKIAVLIMFIVIGARAGTPHNLSDFAPFGFTGITGRRGHHLLLVHRSGRRATAGEEAKNPRRNMPLAILIALLS